MTFWINVVSAPISYGPEITFPMKFRPGTTKICAQNIWDNLRGKQMLLVTCAAMRQHALLLPFFPLQSRNLLKISHNFSGIFSGLEGRVDSSWGGRDKFSSKCNAAGEGGLRIGEVVVATRRVRSQRVNVDREEDGEKKNVFQLK